MNIRKRIIRFVCHWLVKIDQDGELPYVTTPNNNRIIIGLAARDIEAGEVIEYRPGKNTSDMMAGKEKHNANAS